jgi:hypothetical protein
VKSALGGPVFLTVVGVLSFLAVLSCTVGNPMEYAQRQDAVLRTEGAQNDRDEKSLHDRAELAHQYDVIIESLLQIQKSLVNHH